MHVYSPADPCNSQNYFYQPIRVEEEVGVHGSLGNVTMEKSENWPEKKKAGHLISVSLLLKSGSHAPTAV